MGAEPGDAPLRPKAPLWVDRWLRGRVAKRSPNLLSKRDPGIASLRGQLSASVTTNGHNSVRILRAKARKLIVRSLTAATI